MQRDWGRESISALFFVLKVLVALFYLAFCVIVITVAATPYIFKGFRLLWEWAWEQRGECEWRGGGK